MKLKDLQEVPKPPCSILLLVKLKDLQKVPESSLFNTHTYKIERPFRQNKCIKSKQCHCFSKYQSIFHTSEASVRSSLESLREQNTDFPFIHSNLPFSFIDEGLCLFNFFFKLLFQVILKVTILVSFSLLFITFNRLFLSYNWETLFAIC